MYDKRVKVFIIVNLAMVLVCLLRLVQMQWLRDSSIQEEIDRLTQQQLRSTQLKTIRGSILDRNGRPLAVDTPEFQITISYDLSCYADTRIQAAKRLLARERTSNPSGVDIENEIASRLDDLKRIITECNEFGADPTAMAERISQMNDSIWDQRAFLAWRRGKPDPNLLAQYGGRVDVIPLRKALADFERQFPDPEVRLRKIVKISPRDIPEAIRPYSLVELNTDDDLFKAQIEFLDTNDVHVGPLGSRYYPYGSAAAQTIGWVGGVPEDANLFENDPLAEYLGKDDICGRDGIEYACEAILRGRRGEEISDADKSLVSRTQPQFGQDVQLTIDIELQRQIEERLTDPEQNPNYDANMAAVVVDIRSGDILAMVSLPSYDLNRARYDYSDLSHSPEHPLVNRAINTLYPPGSVVKPLVLAAGLESGAVRPDEPISCPAAPAPKGWPNCSIWKQHNGGHDSLWPNDARHAIQGSCNIYFSQLADRLDVKLLQQWLFRFGYGRQALDRGSGTTSRRLMEAAGQLGSTAAPTGARITSAEQLPPLSRAERRYFGIGQGNLRVTPLQVANSFAAIARGGQFKPPRLFLQPKSADANTPTEPVDLGISLANLRVIYDGLSAVVNELHGTAYDAFRGSKLADRGVKVYGKTGSTEAPVHAWFAGFAEDAGGARIAVAVVVEGGEHGGIDAAPVGRHVIELCAEAGYVGQ